ncbi:hypothetical protein PI124_g3234 [Phytophthora idaei]|nr:hypothetical protein PI125_g2398 [Phytophthora idaei]KAG3171316.1 hypothetical protein PI126_g1958 [Phytophthora idaei]KAG3252163.1 hypothetical protein PI124_g3234 [Phytophthora idaei]
MTYELVLATLRAMAHIAALASHNFNTHTPSLDYDCVIADD